MPAQLKEVRNRISSVISTQQITKAMKMVSAAKLRRAQDAIVQMRPYANKLNEILSNIAAATEGDVQLALAEEREPKRILIVAISSDKGLAGSYNANVIKLAWNTIQSKYKTQYEQGNVTLLPIGKKVNDYFKKRIDNVDAEHVGLFSDLDFEPISKVVAGITKDFINGKYDRVEVIYSQFKNAATQIFVAEQFLPIIKVAEDKDEKKQRKTDFIFEPSKEKIIEELVPKILRIQFYKYMLDANASEHGARMTAMDKATENANDLLKDLRLTYNRARQAAITTELSEIVGGAAALSS